MQVNDLMVAGFGCAGLACINAVMWLAQWRSECRWKYIGAETRAWCGRKAALNLGLAFVCVLFGIAGWIMQA